MSKSIRDQVKNNAEFQIISLGPFEFKNVEEPVEVFAIGNPGFAVPKRDAMQGKLKKIKGNNPKRIVIIKKYFEDEPHQQILKKMRF